MIGQALVKELLIYEPDTGLMFWRKNGKVAGTLHVHGYINITIKGRPLKAHRLAWLYVHGSIPPEIDHINGIRHDNRLENLRACTRSQNNYNASIRNDNKTGVKGVHWSNRHDRWVARLGVNGKMVSLGQHKHLFEACCAVFSARNRLHGGYAFRG